MVSIADIDSGDWSWVDLTQFPLWSIVDGVAHYEGQQDNGPVPYSGESLDWPDGEGLEFYVTWPADGPDFYFSYTNDLDNAQFFFQGAWSSVGYSWTDGTIFAGDAVDLDFRPAYFRVYRDGNTFRMQCRPEDDATWTLIYQTTELTNEQINAGWRGGAGAEGLNDWHYVRGVNVAGTDSLRVRMPDNTWQLAGTASSPIYVRISEGGIEKWVAYGAGGGPELTIRKPNNTWATVSSRGGTYGIVRGLIKEGGYGVPNQQVWISLKSAPDYNVPLPGGSGATDAEGKFEIAGFALGQEYRLSFTLPGDRVAGSFFTVTADDPLSIAVFDYA